MAFSVIIVGNKCNRMQNGKHTIVVNYQNDFSESILHILLFMLPHIIVVRNFREFVLYFEIL